MRYFLFLFFLFFTGLSMAQSAAWLLVDTDKKWIQVRQGGRIMAHFPHIALGRNGVGYKQKKGDNITPLGSYRVSRKNKQSHFKEFIGLNYPSIEDAQRGVRANYISKKEYAAILAAHRTNKLPPQNTRLGGQIGIHGLGAASPKIHRMFDWTHGCVAVSNPQIEQLSKWVYIGMPVLIK